MRCFSGSISPPSRTHHALSNRASNNLETGRYRVGGFRMCQRFELSIVQRIDAGMCRHGSSRRLEKVHHNCVYYGTLSSAYGAVILSIIHFQTVLRSAARAASCRRSARWRPINALRLRFSAVVLVVVRRWLSGEAQRAGFGITKAQPHRVGGCSPTTAPGQRSTQGRHCHQTGPQIGGLRRR